MKRRTSTPRSVPGRPTGLRTLLIFVLCTLLALTTSAPAYACAFHFNTELPEASLSKQLTSSASLVAARPGPNTPFRFGSMTLLRGASPSSTPPHLVDSLTRRQLETSEDHAVLFSRDADGTWTRLLLLDEATGPVVAEMLAQADRWAARGGAAARRHFASDLLVHPDPRLRQIALRELDSLDYRTLRNGTYDVTAQQLLAGIADLQAQAFTPIRILLLGIIGGDRVDAEVTGQLHRRVTSGVATNLGAWTMAALEVRGASAIADLEDLLAEPAQPLTRDQTEEIVQALAIQSVSGDPRLRGQARSALLRFISHYPDASFTARAQALVTTVFTGAMTDMKSGSSTGASMFAVLIAFLYGLLHTLGPGHGKAVVISYFAGAGGSVRRGLTMGTQIAVTHVLSAIVVVFLLDFAIRQATGNAPSDYRMIRLTSYAAISVIGAVMLWRATKTALEQRHHQHGHHHSSECASCAAAAKQAEKGAGWLAAAVGVVPCTGALMVMLYGLANDLIGPAIVMVVAISVGMALAMAAIGLAAIWGRHWAVSRWAKNATEKIRFTMGARLAGATLVLFIGAVLFLVTLASSENDLSKIAYGGTKTDVRTVQLVNPAGQ